MNTLTVLDRCAWLFVHEDGTAHFALIRYDGPRMKVRVTSEHVWRIGEGKL